MSLLLALVGAASDLDPVSLGGGRAKQQARRQQRAPRNPVAALLADVEAMRVSQQAERDQRDIEDLQEVIVALFTFKGIF